MPYLELYDDTRDRSIPLRIRLPNYLSRSTPVVILSHGFGGSRDSLSWLGDGCSKGGYLVIQLQHSGSDSVRLNEYTLREFMSSFTTKAWEEESRNRLRDISFVLDQLPHWQANPNHFLSSTMDLEQIALGGHSYGAVTTQIMMGQRLPDGDPYAEPRLKAALLMSPSPGRLMSPTEAFGAITRPILCLSGSEDRSPIRPKMAPSFREQVYDSLPDGAAYQAIFHGSRHGDWTAEEFQTSPLKQTVQAQSIQLVGDFLDAHLRQDLVAKSRLHHQRSHFSQKDSWKWK